MNTIIQIIHWLFPITVLMSCGIAYFSKKLSQEQYDTYHYKYIEWFGYFLVGLSILCINMMVIESYLK